MDFGGPLSAEEHDHIVQKIVNSFEDQVSPDYTPKVNVETAWNARFIIVGGLRSVKPCAEADLKEGEYQAVKAAIEMGSRLDPQLVPQLQTS